jgi:hypothetical protein
MLQTLRLAQRVSVIADVEFGDLIHAIFFSSFGLQTPDINGRSMFVSVTQVINTFDDAIPVKLTQLPFASVFAHDPLPRIRCTPVLRLVQVEIVVETVADSATVVAVIPRRVEENRNPIATTVSRFIPTPPRNSQT